MLPCHWTPASEYIWRVGEREGGRSLRNQMPWALPTMCCCIFHLTNHNGHQPSLESGVGKGVHHLCGSSVAVTEGPWWCTSKWPSVQCIFGSNVLWVLASCQTIQLFRGFTVYSFGVYLYLILLYVLQIWEEYSCLLLFCPSPNNLVKSKVFNFKRLSMTAVWELPSYADLAVKGFTAGKEKWTQ